MLKKRYRDQLTKLFTDLLEYAEANAQYVDCDTCCDESYITTISRFEDRFNAVMNHINSEEGYTKLKLKG